MFVRLFFKQHKIWPLPGELLIISFSIILRFSSCGNVSIIFIVLCYIPKSNISPHDLRDLIFDIKLYSCTALKLCTKKMKLNHVIEYSTFSPK